MINAPIRPKKRLGQNFLLDANTLRKMAAATQLEQTDAVLEIGPGTGMLTQLVLPEVRKLIAVELDGALAAQLKEKFAGEKKLTVIQADFLKTDLAALRGDEELRIIGNIPYYITTPIIFKVLDSPAGLRDMTLLLQREVAERIVAAPNHKEYGILAVFCQTFAEVSVLLQVPRTVFHPRPRVDSALVRWRFQTARSKRIADPALHRYLVRTAFNQRRKMLRVTLRDTAGVEAMQGWDLTRRPEDLTVEEWIDLANALAREDR